MSVTPPEIPPPGERKLARGCLIALAVVGGVVLLLGGICVALIWSSGF